MAYETAGKWCELALEFKLSEFKQASEAICCGIQALVPQRSIALFTWDQLERAVCGEPDVCFLSLFLFSFSFSSTISI